MRNVRRGTAASGSLRGLALGAAALAAIVLAGAPPATAEEASESPYVLELDDASAKVGENAAVRATISLRDGYRFLESYNNRIIRLSSFDDGVEFEREVVPGAIQDGDLVFAVNVTPTKPGRHPINGVFRIGYVEGARTMKMISVPLIANVIGTN